MPKPLDAKPTSDETAKLVRARNTANRIMVNKPMFDLIVELVAAHSRRDNKFRTYRQVIIEGLDFLVRSTVFERFLYLKTYKRELHRGAMAIFVQFDAQERKLVQETRALLQEQSPTTISTHDAIVLAILAAARQASIANSP